MPATDACLPNAGYRNEPTATLAPHLQVAEAIGDRVAAVLPAADRQEINLVAHPGRPPEGGSLLDDPAASAPWAHRAFLQTCNFSGPRAPQPSSIWAAVGACEGREGGGRTVKHRETDRPNLPAGSWAFTTIHHTLLSSALPPCPTSTDRGEGRARTRITGGLVMPDQGRGVPPADPGGGEAPRPVSCPSAPTTRSQRPLRRDTMPVVAGRRSCCAGVDPDGCRSCRW